MHTHTQCAYFELFPLPSFSFVFLLLVYLRVCGFFSFTLTNKGTTYFWCLRYRRICSFSQKFALIYWIVYVFNSSKSLLLFGSTSATHSRISVTLHVKNYSGYSKERLRKPTRPSYVDYCTNSHFTWSIVVYSTMSPEGFFVSHVELVSCDSVSCMV